MRKFKLSEHTRTVIYPQSISVETAAEYERGYIKCSLIEPRVFKTKRGKVLSCFQLYTKGGIVMLEANYYIGLDWLIPEETFIHVLPKVNSVVLKAYAEQLDLDEPDVQNNNTDPDEVEVDASEVRELNYLKMFLDALAHPIVTEKIDELILIDWGAPKIEIEQENDMLTPFLIVHFLKLVTDIVRKGLKKSYYKVRRQLNNRVKGKILIGDHIKINVMKHLLTRTYCEFQEFGVDSSENRFLKKVMRFLKNYVAANKQAFKGVEDTIGQMINFCSPVFEHVSEVEVCYDLKYIKTNPFFKEYREAIKIGDYILRRFSYNITNTVSKKIQSPPFWIDMPMLFELYTYSHLLNVFTPDEVEYHHTTYGNELDFLISKEGNKMVVDAKYKMQYKAGLIHSDIRQVSGYARLVTVYEALNISSQNEVIDCLIIYPSSESKSDDYNLEAALLQKLPIKAYKKIFKLGIPMPWIQDQD